NDVEVTDQNGVVTLSGQVPSLLAKQRAARIAETVRGVVLVENKLTIRPLVPRREADEIERFVEQALLNDPATEAYQVTVAAAPDGKVTLTGRLESHAEKELVGRVASSARGVTAVSNDVEVEYRAGRPDSELAADIRGLLHWDAYVEDGDIEVDVANGVAKLSGEVASAAEKRRATTLAWMAGIKELQTEALKVTGAGRDASTKAARADRASDENVSAAVQRALTVNTTSKLKDLRVNVRDGVATLRGGAQSLQAKRTAERVAMSVAGVEEVRSRIRVGGMPAVSDEQLRQRIERALASNPITESYEIDAAVDRGDVTLTGRVDSWFERGMADNVSASVKGVRAVDNHLIVANPSERLALDPFVDDWSIHEFAWYQPSQPTIRRGDAAIARDVRDELWWSPFVDRDDITVSVHNGVVTLSGEVDSYAESRAAIENAFEGGAAGVVNELQVERPELTASDSD
ncbi:MAG: BON domain-containing protein, partial [Pseudomonadota bacterium]|nr:BON domain-containing protein [Pseudomonadota bacterium]